MALMRPLISAAQTQPGDTAAGSTGLAPSAIAELSPPMSQVTGNSISELRQAAENGSATAQNHLVYLYTNGTGVERDYREAARWYRAAADRGFASAQYNLGALFEHGLGVSQDYQTAATYYQQAARQGHVLAQPGWGSCMSGVGVFRRT